MKLYAWHADGHGPSFFVMAESEEQATFLVRAHIEHLLNTDPVAAHELKTYDWPRWHKLAIYDQGQVADSFGDV